MEYTVYKLTNVINGMGYVGITCNFKRRMKEHRSSNNANARISEAIKEYGWENFKQEILEVCDAEIAEEREKYWIDMLGTKYPAGYNGTAGGGGILSKKPDPYYTPELRFKKALKCRKSTFTYPNLQAEMDRQKITRRGLAQMIGVNHEAVSAWMASKYEPKISSAIKVKEVLGVDMPLEELFAKKTAQQSE